MRACERSGVDIYIYYIIFQFYENDFNGKYTRRRRDFSLRVFINNIVIKHALPVCTRDFTIKASLMYNIQRVRIRYIIYIHYTAHIINTCWYPYLYQFTFLPSLRAYVDYNILTPCLNNILIVFIHILMCTCFYLQVDISVST